MRYAQRRRKNVISSVHNFIPEKTLPGLSQDDTPKKINILNKYMLCV